MKALGEYAVRQDGHDVAVLIGDFNVGEHEAAALFGQGSWHVIHIPGRVKPTGQRHFDIHASTIIFLTLLMTETDFRQALARVKRQGNPAVAKGQTVKVWFLACKDTVEDDPLNLQAKLRIAQEGSSTRQAAASSEPSSSSAGISAPPPASS